MNEFILGNHTDTKVEWDGNKLTAFRLINGKWIEIESDPSVLKEFGL